MALPARASSGRVISKVVLGLIALSVVREVSAFVPVFSTFPRPLQSASVTPSRLGAGARRARRFPARARDALSLQMKEGRVGSVQLEKVATVVSRPDSKKLAHAMRPYPHSRLSDPSGGGFSSPGARWTPSATWRCTLDGSRPGRPGRL